MPDTSSASGDAIVCPLLPWYSRLNHRFSGLSAMLLVFGLWFYIDGTVRWPKENAQADQREAFIKEIEAAKSAGALEAWLKQAQANGLQGASTLNLSAANIADMIYARHAAQQGLPEKPKRHSDEELTQQVHLACFMFVALAALLVYLFLIRNRQLIGEADHLITPNGQRVAFANAFRIDKRKWDKQGLAYVFYRDGQSERKAVIDDLQFDGAGRVLDRLLANFHGELIEKLPESNNESEPTESSADAAS